MLGVIWQVIVAIFLLLPLTVSFIYSFAGRWTSILPQNLTFRFYLDKFKDSTFFLGILRGIFISALPVILVNIIILLTLFAVIVYFPKMEKYGLRHGRAHGPEAGRKGRVLIAPSRPSKREKDCSDGAVLFCNFSAAYSGLENFDRQRVLAGSGLFWNDLHFLAGFN